jgi:hypothetical protein
MKNDAWSLILKVTPATSSGTPDSAFRHASRAQAWTLRAGVVTADPSRGDTVCRTLCLRSILALPFRLPGSWRSEGAD